jgi:hypothetical protein
MAAARHYPEILGFKRESNLVPWFQDFLLYLMGQHIL